MSEWKEKRGKTLGKVFLIAMRSASECVRHGSVIRTSNIVINTTDVALGYTVEYAVGYTVGLTCSAYNTRVVLYRILLYYI